jgi:bacillithiol disulfide reductase
MTDVIVIGAGPSGLATAIEARRAGLTCTILEKGSLVDYIRRFPLNLVWFSTPELLEIGDVPFPIPTVRPTRVDTLAYYQKVAQFHELDIRYFDSVESVEPTSDGFTLTTAKQMTYSARFVVVATGYFDNPNRLDVPGESLGKVSHYYDEPFAGFDRDIAVVGGRNSAVEAALDLYRHGARVTLIHRGKKLSEGVKYWILPDIENRIKAEQITALFESTVLEIQENHIVVSTPRGVMRVKNDMTYVLIGFRPDTRHLLRFGMAIDPETLAPEHDGQTFETTVPGLYVAGSVVAGRFNNKIFVENGRLHGKAISQSIMSHLAAHDQAVTKQ